MRAGACPYAMEPETKSEKNLFSPNNLTKTSPLREKAQCTHFDECNGCHYLHTSSAQEIEYKKNLFEIKNDTNKQQIQSKTEKWIKKNPNCKAIINSATGIIFQMAMGKAV